MRFLPTRSAAPAESPTAFKTRRQRASRQRGGEKQEGGLVESSFFRVGARRAARQADFCGTASSGAALLSRPRWRASEQNRVMRDAGWERRQVESVDDRLRGPFRLGALRTTAWPIPLHHLLSSLLIGVIRRSTRKHRCCDDRSGHIKHSHRAHREGKEKPNYAQSPIARSPRHYAGIRAYARAPDGFGFDGPVPLSSFDVASPAPIRRFASWGNGKGERTQGRSAEQAIEIEIQKEMEIKTRRNDKWDDFSSAIAATFGATQLASGFTIFISVRSTQGSAERFSGGGSSRRTCDRLADPSIGANCSTAGPFSRGVAAALIDVSGAFIDCRSCCGQPSAVGARRSSSHTVPICAAGWAPSGSPRPALGGMP
uniref:Uncharacterized protein n=1 Tax=Plectus sambesii TaxID=2011161 RepID=A0A914WJH9_9BILA